MKYFDLENNDFEFQLEKKNVKDINTTGNTNKNDKNNFLSIDFFNRILSQELEDENNHKNNQENRADLLIFNKENVGKDENFVDDKKNDIFIKIKGNTNKKFRDKSELNYKSKQSKYLPKEINNNYIFDNSSLKKNKTVEKLEIQNKDSIIILNNIIKDKNTEKNEENKSCFIQTEFI
jgi:hypothetical protein